jgi:hypothetical protein
MQGPGPGELDILDPELNEGYLNQQLPSSRDREIVSLLNAATQSGQLEDLSHLLERPQSAVLLAFAERMASLAARTSDRDALRSGLLAAAVATVASDVRDALLVLPLLWRSAEHLKLDPATELAMAAKRLPLASATLEQFAARSPEDRKIEAMGYVESVDEDGFRYARTW